jgi:hypothetical protein
MVKQKGALRRRAGGIEALRLCPVSFLGDGVPIAIARQGLFPKLVDKAHHSGPISFSGIFLRANFFARPLFGASSQDHLLSARWTGVGEPRVWANGLILGAPVPWRCSSLVEGRKFKSLPISSKPRLSTNLV